MEVESAEVDKFLHRSHHHTGRAGYTVAHRAGVAPDGLAEELSGDHDDGAQDQQGGGHLVEDLEGPGVDAGRLLVGEPQRVLDAAQDLSHDISVLFGALNTEVGC